MALIATKDKYHVALDSRGLVLQGAPDRPSYLSRNAPVYGTRFASGDRDYNDLSQWWYFIQTDWGAGFKDAQSWADDAKFYLSQNIDAYSAPGSLKLIQQVSAFFNFGTIPTAGIETALNPGNLTTQWRAPGNTANVIPAAYSGFTSAWSNPTGVFTSDNNYATASQGNQAYQTKFYGFAFSLDNIPSDAEIVGIETRMEAKYTANPSGNQLKIQAVIYKDVIVDGGTEATAFGLASRSHPQSGGLTNSDAIYTRGGAGDLWNTTWTPAEVSAVNFGFALVGTTGSSPTTTDYSVDHFECRIHYRLGSAATAKYVGTDRNTPEFQPIVYKQTDPNTWEDISSAHYANSNRGWISHLAAPFGVLWVHTAVQLSDNGTDVLNTWTGANWADQTTSINNATGNNIDAVSSRCGAAYADKYYFFIDNPEQGYALLSANVAVPSSSSDYTLIFQRPASSTYPVSCVELNGSLYYLVATNTNTQNDIISSTVELRRYDIAADVDVRVYEFKNVFLRFDWDVTNHLTVVGSTLLITLTREIWKLQAGVLSRIFRRDDTKQALDTDSFGNPGEYFPWLQRGGVVRDNKVWWGNLIYDPIQEYFYNSFRGSSDTSQYPNNLIEPIFVDQNDEIFFVEQGSLSIMRKFPGSGYKTGASNTAFLILSNHDKLQSIDKLLNQVTIGFNQLRTGEAIRVYYTTNPIPEPAIANWNLVGSATFANDGGTVVFKNLLFPVGTIGKRIWFRVELEGNGTTTPTLNDFTLEYLPMPDYRKEWQLVCNLGDEVKRLDGQFEERTAREMKMLIERSWMTKSALDFQDMDFAATSLGGTPLTPTDTIINVESTDDFPEQGRIRIDDEEIFYQGKTRTSFTGCMRGQRGTLALAHSGGQAVHNGYRVLVIGVESRIPIANEDKELEYTFALNLREV